jgi:hypothetical protein
MLDILTDWHMEWRATPMTDTRAPPVDDDAGFLNEPADSNSPREVLKSALKSELRLLVGKGKVLSATYGGKLQSLLDVDPLRFYKDNLAELPHLGSLSCTLFSLQASSAESERGFSRAGISDTALRNRLSPATLEAATIVRSASIGGIKLASIVEDMQKAAKEVANKKRSTTQLENAAKRSRAASTQASAASTDVGGNADDSMPRATAAAAATLVSDDDDDESNDDAAAASADTAGPDVADDDFAADTGDDDADEDAEDLSPEDPPELDEFSDPVRLADYGEFE